MNDPQVAALLARADERFPSALATRPPPCLVMLSGLPGSGKSTVAAYLARALRAALIESDFVRKQLFPVPTYGADESEETHRVCRALLEANLRNGCHAVYDATNLREAHRKRGQALAQACAARFAVVQVVADEAEICERLLRRKLSPQTESCSDAGWDVYLLLKSEVEPIDMPHVVVNTSSALNQQLASLLAHLSA